MLGKNFFDSENLIPIFVFEIYFVGIEIALTEGNILLEDRLRPLGHHVAVGV